MSKLLNLAESARDHSASFAVGAVPAFLGMTCLATGFSVCHAIAEAIGLSGFVAGAAGVIGTAMMAGPILVAGVLLGGAGLAGLAGLAVLADKIPFVRKAGIKGPSIALGAVAGMGASIALVGHLAASDPQVGANTPQTNPVAVASVQETSRGGLSPLFSHTLNGEAKKPQAASAAVTAATGAAAPRLDV